MKRLSKFIGLVLSVSLVVCLSACAGKQETQTGTDFSATMTNTTSSETPQTETQSTPDATQESTNSGKSTYYTELLQNDTQAKQDAENKRAADLELADIMLRECTKKLSNCTIDITATTSYKCGDLDKQETYAGGVPTNGVYEVATELCFADNASQLSCKQDKNLYRDKNLVGQKSYTLVAQTTTSDNWSDKMNFLMYYVIEDEGDIPPFAIKDEMTKGEVYKYISKDVRSCLSRFLSIDVEDIEEKDGNYVITGKTKDIFVIVDEMGGNAITNNATWVNNKGQKNAGLMNTTGVLVKHKNDVTLYIDKATETLVAIEAKSENSLNEEETIMQGVVKNVGTTEITSYDVPDDLLTIAISDVSKINSAITYSR